MEEYGNRIAPKSRKTDLDGGNIHNVTAFTDVADYCDVDPLFGTLDDFDQLVSEIHKRGMKIIIDYVPNHTSDQHPWFIESRASRDNPKRDWYIWRDPKPDGSAPNNWGSFFGGPAWTLDEKTGQYYLQPFVAEVTSRWMSKAIVMSICANRAANGNWCY